MRQVHTLIHAAAVTTLALASTTALAQRGAAAASTPAPWTGSALFVDIDLAGFQAVGEFGDAQNAFVTVDIGTLSSVLGFQWTGLSFTSAGTSWQEELVLSVNDSLAANFLDVAPADGLDFPGTFGPGSGTWGVDGLSFGAPFEVMADGLLLVTVYDYFDNDGVDVVVDSGSLRVFYQPVPEPGTYGLMALGLLGLAAVARRRRAV